MTSIATLKKIQSRDPDGGSVRPTDQDYRNFEAWVIENFGRSAWIAYQGNWDTGNDDWE